MSTLIVEGQLLKKKPSKNVNSLEKSLLNLHLRIK